MRTLFLKYLNAVCSPDEFKKVTVWLADKCHDKAIFELMKDWWDENLKTDSYQAVNLEKPWQMVRLAISKKENAILKRQMIIFRWIISAAAVLAIILYTATLHFPKSSPPEVSVQSQTLTVPNGARSNFILPDGSKVWLNSGSSLTFNSDFNRKRTLTVEGEAYFEVEKGSSPFIINTALGHVEITGTRLNVRCSGHQNRFETTVEEGSVTVYFPQIGKKGQLEPGQQIRIVNGKWEVLEVETDLFTSWKEGKIIFRKEYLPEVAKRLERWYNVKIELDQDPRLSQIHYTGILEMESFSEVMELLRITASINYTYNEKTRVISITHR